MFYNFLFTKSKYQEFGINFSYKIDLLKLDRLARRMIKNCDRWKTNWMKVREEIAPELRQRMRNEMDRICADMTEEEIQMFINKVKELKELKEKENE